MFDHGEGVVGIERFTGRFKRSQIARIVSSFVRFIWFENDPSKYPILRKI